MAKTGTAKKAAEHAPEGAQEGAETVRDGEIPHDPYEGLMEPAPGRDEGGQGEAPPCEYAVAWCGALNLREEPSLEARIIAELPQGVGVSCTGERRDAWWEVVTGRLAGWVMAKYLAPLAAAMEEDAAHD